MKKYTYDENYFSIPNINNTYWAGFWAADGCVSQDYCEILTLSNKDKEHLEKFRNDIKLSKEIRVFFRKDEKAIREYCSLTVYSKQWKEDLNKNYNITPKKTLTLQPPNITDKYLIDAFIIGYIDGDGSIGLDKNNKIYLQIVGTKKVLEWMQNRFSEIISCNNKNMTSGCIIPTKKVFTFRISHDPALILLKHFNTINVYKMARKWNKVELAVPSENNKYIWSKEEETLLAKAYKSGYTVKQIKEQYMSHRTILGIKDKLRLLRKEDSGLSKSIQIKWSEEDEKKIKENYSSMNYKELQQKYFPNRTPTQVESKISRMKITKKVTNNG